MMYGYGNMISPSNRLFSGGGGANPLWNGLLAYYTTDNTPNDALGNYNGILVNGATYGTGIINQGFSFDGVNDFISFQNNFDFDGTTDFSFNFWVNISSTTNYSLFRKMNALLSLPGYLTYILNGKVEFLIQNSNTNRLYVKTVGSISTGFTMITFSYNSLTRTLKIFFNGVEQTLTTVTSTFTLSSSNSESLFFGQQVSSITYFGGILDEVGIFNKELTSSEVTELYNSGTGKQYPN